MFDSFAACIWICAILIKAEIRIIVRTPQCFVSGSSIMSRQYDCEHENRLLKIIPLSTFG